MNFGDVCLGFAVVFVLGVLFFIRRMELKDAEFSAWYSDWEKNLEHRTKAPERAIQEETKKESGEMRLVRALENSWERNR